LAGFRVAGFAAGARLAFGFAALALTDRFAADALRPTARDEDRRRPFVRLLLICRSVIRLHLGDLAAAECAELNIAAPLNQFTQEFNGSGGDRLGHSKDIMANKEKHLKVIVGYVKVPSGLRRLNPPRREAPSDLATSFISELSANEAVFRVAPSD
jgi:hypothetical protein